MISLTSVLDGCPVEIRGPRCLFHLHYCASQPSTPPSALHPTPLRHFCSLISFTSAFSAGFSSEIPQLMMGAYPAPLDYILIISPPRSFFSSLTPVLEQFTCLFLAYPQLSPHNSVCKEVRKSAVSTHRPAICPSSHYSVP